MADRKAFAQVDGTTRHDIIDAGDRLTDNETTPGLYVPVPQGTGVQTMILANEGAGTLKVVVDGDLDVQGTRTSLESETVLITDPHFYMNKDYTTASGRTGGLVVNYLPTATGATTAGAGVFTAGSDGVSDPTVTTDGSVFAAGELIQISGSASNDGLYEVHTDAAGTLTIRSTADGVTNQDEDFTQGQFTAETDTGATITKVTVTVLRGGTDGIWETGSGSTTGITFSDLITAATTVSNLDDAYDGGGSGAGRTITVDAGTVHLDGTAGSDALQIDGNVVFDNDDSSDIGASGATRPRRVYVGTEVVVGSTSTLDSDSLTIDATSGTSSIVLTPPTASSATSGSALYSPKIEFQAEQFDGSSSVVETMRLDHKVVNLGGTDFDQATASGAFGASVPGGLRVLDVLNENSGSTEYAMASFVLFGDPAGTDPSAFRQSRLYLRTPKTYEGAGDRVIADGLELASSAVGVNAEPTTYIGFGDGSFGPTAGTFDITSADFTSSPITVAFDATAATLKTAIDTEIAGSVTVSGGGDGAGTPGHYDIDWSSSGETPHIPSDLALDGSGLTGGNSGFLVRLDSLLAPAVRFTNKSYATAANTDNDMRIFADFRDETTGTSRFVFRGGQGGGEAELFYIDDDGDVEVPVKDMIVTAGDAIVTAGDVTITAGDVNFGGTAHEVNFSQGTDATLTIVNGAAGQAHLALTEGDLSLTDGDINFGGTASAIQFSDGSDATLTLENDGAGEAHVTMTAGDLTLTSGGVTLNGTGEKVTLAGSGTGIDFTADNQAITVTDSGDGQAVLSLTNTDPTGDASRLSIVGSYTTHPAALSLAEADTTLTDTTPGTTDVRDGPRIQFQGHSLQSAGPDVVEGREADIELLVTASENAGGVTSEGTYALNFRTVGTTETDRNWQMRNDLAFLTPSGSFGTDVAGPRIIVGNNGTATGTTGMGLLTMTSDGGNEFTLHVSDAGDLYISALNSLPGSDTDGTIVGTQS